jgi:serine/threonine protein kinase
MSLTHLLTALPEPLSCKYALEKVLGVGSYAVVYQIRNKKTGKAFALKVVETEPMRVRLMTPQLEREVTILEMHAATPHIVQLLEVTRTSTHIFLRFPLCRRNFEELSMDQGPMREEEAFAWLREMCLGVQGLHETGVVHRDLKPSNFLIDAKGKLRICDFGWACWEEQDLTGCCGTPEYSAPETSRDGVVHTAKVDIYGLGATLQHLLLGRVPNGPGDLPGGLSMAAADLIDEMMDDDPEARPSIDDLLSRPQVTENTLLAHLWSNWRVLFNVPSFTTKQKNWEAEMSCGLGGLVS